MSQGRKILLFRFSHLLNCNLQIAESLWFIFTVVKKLILTIFATVLIVYWRRFLRSLLSLIQSWEPLWPAVYFQGMQVISNEKINVTIGDWRISINQGEEAPSGDLYGPFQLNIFYQDTKMELIPIILKLLCKQNKIKSGVGIWKTNISPHPKLSLVSIKVKDDHS